MFKYDSPLYKGMTFISNIFILNILWIITSIPILTIGITTTALYKVMFDLHNYKEVNVIESFFYYLKKDLKKNFLIGLVVIGSGLFLLMDWIICLSFKNAFPQILFLALGSISIVYFIVSHYIFGITAFSNSSIKNTIKSGFYIGYKNPLQTILLLMTSIIFILINLTIVLINLLTILFGFSLYVYVITKIQIEVFKKHDEILITT